MSPASVFPHSAHFWLFLVSGTLYLTLRLCAASEKPLEGSSWSTLQLVAMSLVPCLLLGGGVAAGLFVRQSRHCAYTAHKQDPEEHLDDQMLMSADKCLKDLIGDMSTSGSGSGRRLGRGGCQQTSA